MSKSIITSDGLKIVIMLAMLVIILAGVKVAAAIVVPLILSLFIAVVLNPVVRGLEKLHIPRVLAVFLLLTILVVTVFLLTSYLGAALNELARTLPLYRASLFAPLQKLALWLQDAGIAVSAEDLTKYFDPGAAMSVLTKTVAQLSNAMTSVVLLLLTVVFMLLEVPQLPGKLRQVMSRPAEGMNAIAQAVNDVTHYLALKTAISLLTGLVVWGMLVLLEVRFAFIWGLLAFLLNFIPTIGSILAAIPPVLQTLVFIGPYEALLVTGGYLAVNLVLGNILEPRVMGRGLGLSTLVVFLSLIFWGWLLGPVGMLLSVPLTIVLKITLEQTNGGHNIAVLLSDLPDSAQNEGSDFGISQKKR
ncbi:AI-2E family transporter [Leminorella grimontii]|uniref:AI-2E family transporter n=1 Tax=Leminorella grimontii TaxID=82981 RepID=UPI0032208970